MRTTLALLAVLTAFLLLAEDAIAPPSPTGAALRAKARELSPRVIIDDDSGDASSAAETIPATAEGFLGQRLETATAGDATTVVFNSGTIGLCATHNSKVTDIIRECFNPNCHNLIPELLEQGLDPLQLAIDHCHGRKKELWGSIRVNDVHDAAHYPRRLSTLKKAHPEYLFGRNPRPLFGQHTGFDFANAPVAELLIALGCEILDYDVDGLLLDFQRNPLVFRSVAFGGEATDAERAVFDGIMERLSRHADAASVSANRGKLLGIRVVDDPECCRRMGYDVSKWLKEGWIDYIILGGDRIKLHTDAEALAALPPSPAKRYISVDSDRTTVKGPFARRGKAAIYAQMAAAYAAGADGVFLFNLSFPHSNFGKHIKRTAEEYKFHPKRYFPCYVRNLPYAVFQSEHESVPQLIDNGVPRAIGATPLTLVIESGDQPGEDTEVLARNPRIKLVLRSTRQLNALLNGHQLAKASSKKDNLHYYDVKPDFLKKGRNLIVLSQAEDVQPNTQCLLKGDARAPLPWRRLFDQAGSGDETEMVVEEALKLLDFGKGSREMMNIAHPLPDFGGTAFAIAFEMKVEESDTPEAVVLRLADGRHCELVTFEKNRIGFAYAGKSIEFVCDDGFHQYELRCNQSDIELFVDGQSRLKAPMECAVHDARTRLENALGYDRLRERSIIVGSLSGPGTSVSLWRNITLSSTVALLSDCMLSIDFPQQQGNASK